MRMSIVQQSHFVPGLTRFHRNEGRVGGFRNWELGWKEGNVFLDWEDGRLYWKMPSRSVRYRGPCFGESRVYWYGLFRPLWHSEMIDMKSLHLIGPNSNQWLALCISVWLVVAYRPPKQLERQTAWTDHTQNIPSMTKNVTLMQRTNHLLGKGPN